LNDPQLFHIDSDSPCPIFNWRWTIDLNFTDWFDGTYELDESGTPLAKEILPDSDDSFNTTDVGD